jgi:hypothetical protein
LYIVRLQQQKDKNNPIILVDIIVTNGQIRALRPIFSNGNDAIPHTEPEKSVWLKTYANTDRINRRILGNLQKRSLHQAQKLVNYYSSSSSNNSSNNKDGEYGSIHAYNEDFVRLI